MGLENFNPTVWAPQLLLPLYKNLVFGNLVNREYESQTPILEYGDTVKILEIDDVDVSDYTKYSDVTWQTMAGADKSLLIDQAKSFSVQLDDIDKAQNRPKVMAGIMEKAAYAIKDTIDQHIAGKYGDAGDSVTALTVTAGNVLTNLSNFQLEMDENNVATTGRFIVVPPWYHQYLVQAATGIIGHTGVPKVMDNGLIMNGYVGMLFGFNVLISNNVNNNSTVWNIMAFDRSAISYVGQLSKLEATRIEARFGDGVKGLYVFGCKVTRPEALIYCAATKG